MPATGPTSPFTRSMSGVCSPRRRARVWMGLRFRTTMAYWPSCSRLMRFCRRDRVEAGAGEAAPGVAVAAGEVVAVGSAVVGLVAAAVAEVPAAGLVEPVAVEPVAGAEVRV